MKQLATHLASLLALATLLACGTSGGTTKAATDAAIEDSTNGSAEDTATDTVADTAVDTAVDTATVDTGSGSDTTADTSETADTAADTAADTTADTTLEDTATDTAPDTVADTAADTTVEDTAADTTADTTPIPEDWIPSRCSPIEAELAAAREEMALCDRSSQCALQLNPLCPYGGGCYEFFRLDKDRSLLTSVYDRFVAGNCGDFVCRCASPPPSGCIDGSCQACPDVCTTACPADCLCATDGCGCDIPVCAGSLTDCGGLLEAMRTAIADMQPCNADSDCTAELAPACAELGCYYAHNTSAQTSHLASLSASYDSLSCSSLSTSACRCGPPPSAVCRANRCVTE
jgi:hypothetical protein